MNGKKLKFKLGLIATLALALLLPFSTVAYAWNTSGISDITSAAIYVTGYSYTATDIVVDKIEVYAYLYKGDELKDFANEVSYQDTWAQGDVSSFNDFGVETWFLEGYHKATEGSLYHEFETYDSVNT